MEIETIDRFAEMKALLDENQLPCSVDELVDYIQMFDVIGELTLGQLETSEMVRCFAALAPVMKDPEVITSRDKMKRMFAMMEELPESAGKMDRKTKLFFAFCVYAASNILSENDDKKHYFIGMPEFQSADYIKYKMEEYWGLDPFMFSWAVQ
jgi:hypothetical protein